MERAFERKLKNQIAALGRRKANLETLIAAEMKRRMPCTFTLRRLKKMKLSIKDRITELRRVLDVPVMAKQA